MMNADLEKWNTLIKRQDEFYHRCAKTSGLADAQFWVLYALCETQNALCQNTVCENWCYSKQTVSAAVASLEKSGQVYLDYAQGSRKRKNLYLTEAGEAFCCRHIRSLQKAEENALNRLSDAERSEFFRIYEHLLAELEEESRDLLKETTER